MADTSGMVLHESRFSRDFYAPDEAGVHVACDPSRGYFIRWQFESSDSMMSDESFAKTCNMKLSDYLMLMFGKYNAHNDNGIYFEKRIDCQRAVDDVIAPAVLGYVMGRKRA